MSSLVGEMETSWLNRTYPREEYIRDGEWEELTDDVFDCVVVYSDTDRPETVTIDGRTWTADITFGENRVILEVTGKIDRGEFGMTFNQALGSGNMVVSNQVKLSLDISAVKAA